MALLTNTQVVPPSETTRLAQPRPPDDEPGTAINAVNCIHFISDHAPTLTLANMACMSAVVSYVLFESDWAETPRTKQEIKSTLARALSEAGRSKRYEFTSLGWQIAQHPEAKALAAEAVRLGSMHSGIQYLAKKFLEVATLAAEPPKGPSVASLARYFGTARSSGQRQQSFLDWLRKTVEKTLRAGGSVHLPEAVTVLLHGASGDQLLQLMKRLLTLISEPGLRELGEIIARTLEHRQARTRRSVAHDVAFIPQPDAPGPTLN